MRNGSRNTFGKEQFEVTLAHDGVTALQMVDEIEPDIGLLDVTMADLQVLRQRCAGWRGQDGPASVDAHRAATISRTEVHGLELGADDYLTKPFNARELAARIHAISRQKKSATLADVPETLPSSDR